MDVTISSLKELYGDSVEMPLPINTTSSYLQTNSRFRKKKGKFCDHCHRKGHNKFECWAHMSATGQSENANILDAEHKSKNCGNKKIHDDSSPDGNQKGRTDGSDETFFTSFVGVNESYLSTEYPFAIVDTGAVASMFGKEYLNKIISILSLQKVPIESNKPSTIHKFGIIGEPIEKDFTCRLPWSVKDVEGMIHTFNIVVDVLPGPHPFLSGMPALKKMKAQIVLGQEKDTFSMKLAGKSIHILLVTTESHPHLLHGGKSKATESQANDEAPGSDYTISSAVNFHHGQ
jgi:hypothetical protein